MNFNHLRFTMPSLPLSLPSRLPKKKLKKKTDLLTLPVVILWTIEIMQVSAISYHLLFAITKTDWRMKKPNIVRNDSVICFTLETFTWATIDYYLFLCVRLCIFIAFYCFTLFHLLLPSSIGRRRLSSSLTMNIRKQIFVHNIILKNLFHFIAIPL